MVNMAQSFLVVHFSINCMLLLVTLGFPQLIFSISLLAVAISYSLFCSIKLTLFLG